MARLQALAIVVGALLIGGFAWLHEHDKRIEHELESKHRADSLAYDSKQIEGLREALVKINQEYMKQTKLYNDRRRVLNDSLESIGERLSTLLAQADAVVPDGSRHIISEIGTACKTQADMIYTQLVMCDALRQQAIANGERKDTIIWRLQNSRDGYKQMYEEEKKFKTSGGTWATIGKVGTAGAVIGGLAKLGQLIHLW